MDEHLFHFIPVILLKDDEVRKVALVLLEIFLRYVGNMRPVFLRKGTEAPVEIVGLRSIKRFVLAAHKPDREGEDPRARRNVQLKVFMRHRVKAVMFEF